MCFHVLVEEAEARRCCLPCLENGGSQESASSYVVGRWANLCEMVLR